ncbi:MAG: ATP-binding protein [Verrucomicrobia bacterium]|nr:ATP-binding protein [Verrucomicrobiota bacterium]MBI3868749.1 ATP-binding protein [Verrucomicrobiota bacterium]
MPEPESPSGGPRSFEIRLPNRLEEAPRVHEAFARFLGSLAVSPRARLAFEIVLEELFANMVHHAFEDGQEHWVAFRFTLSGPDIRIDAVDGGRAFDPTSHPAPDVGRPMEERPVGGLGVHMIRRSMDRIEYRREDGRNKLSLWRRWAD